MGRPQDPLDRDGSPVREFAFWLRDLRKRSGLTYEQLGKNAHYATSTVQAAAAGKRFPTLRVALAFAEACGGDTTVWREYWTQIQRALDRAAPDDFEASVVPPWVDRPPLAMPSPTAPSSDSSYSASPSSASRSPASPSSASWSPDSRSPAPPYLDVLPSADPAQLQLGTSGNDEWFIESFTALLRLNVEPAEALEQRVIVAAVDGLSELKTSLSLPRHPDDADPAHGLESELLYGGMIEVREQPFESYFENVIALPRPLARGDRHEYGIIQRIPPGQRMASHYVHVPLRRSDYFKLRVRFSLEDPPQAVWTLYGAPTAVIYERGPAAETTVPDRFGEVTVSFRNLRPGLGYGLCWRD
jgi:transcriptional regulator with XRE-family HTH domain